MDLDEEIRQQYLEKVCDGGEQYTSCGLLGVMFRYGEGGSEDRTEAILHLADSCAVDNWTSCHNFGEILEDGDSADQKHASDLFQESCKAGIGISCLRLGMMYARGVGVPKDEGMFALLTDRGCELGSATSCFVLGAVYSSGKKVPIDKEKSTQYFKKACSLGFKSPMCEEMLQSGSSSR